MLGDLLGGLLGRIAQDGLDLLLPTRRRLRAFTLAIASLLAAAALFLAWRGSSFLAIASGCLAVLFVGLLAFDSLLKRKGALGPFVYPFNEDDR